MNKGLKELFTALLVGTVCTLFLMVMLLPIILTEGVSKHPTTSPELAGHSSTLPNSN